MSELLPMLCQGTLDHLPAKGVAVPAYLRKGVVPGVVHLGLGAFNRAHQGLVFDELLAGGDLRWGVLGVATRSWTLADALAGQDGLYAVKLANAAGSSWRVSGSMLQTCAARRESERVHAVTVSVTQRVLGLAIASSTCTRSRVSGAAKRRYIRRRGSRPGARLRPSSTTASCSNPTLPACASGLVPTPKTGAPEPIRNSTKAW